MKALNVLLYLTFINLIQDPFDQFLKEIPDGWSSHRNKNKLVISRDSLVKIQYFNYGMEADPPILEHKYEIIIDYSKRLSDKQIQKRKNQQDSVLMIYRNKFELNPTKTNWAQYEIYNNTRQLDKRLRIPFYSDDKYSYFMLDNFPSGYQYIHESDKSEIEEVVSKLKKEH